MFYSDVFDMLCLYIQQSLFDLLQNSINELLYISLQPVCLVPILKPYSQLVAFSKTYKPYAVVKDSLVTTHCMLFISIGANCYYRWPVFNTLLWHDTVDSFNTIRSDIPHLWYKQVFSLTAKISGTTVEYKQWFIWGAFMSFEHG